MVEASPVFLKLRGVSFFCITVISFLWIILLCVELFLRWDVSDVSERSLIVLLILVNSITVIMLPILILCRFRAYLDAARLLFLLMSHIGVAAVFTYWNPKFQCPDQSPDEQGVCKLINIYILLASWVDPSLLLAYTMGLLLMVYKRLRLPATVLPSKAVYDLDEEAATGRHLSLPIMPPVMRQSDKDCSMPSTSLPAVLDRTSRTMVGQDVTSEEQHRKSIQEEKRRRNTAGRSLPPSHS